VSTIEERLSRDIEAVTGGIVMTDSELRDARAAVEDRIEIKRERDRRRGVVVAVAAAAAVFVGVVGWQAFRSDDATPSPAKPVPTPTLTPLADADEAFLAGDTPTPELLRGVWRLDNPTESRMLVMFTADGGIRYDDTGRLFQDPLVHGTFDMAGDLITVQVDGGSAQCEGTALALRAAVNEDGGLNVVPVDAAEGCGRPMRHQWVLEQQLPTSEGRALNAPRDIAWDRLADREAVVGDWYVAGGGHLLELRADNTYSLLAGYGDVVDLGSWADDASSTRLTLVSSSDSPRCREGDTAVLADLQQGFFGATALKGTVERDDCAAGFAKKAWLKLAP
jgi:hypothetical protein